MPTRYDPYNDPYSDRIAELIRGRGDIAARQALESGDIWGRGIQNIAGQLGAGVQAYAQVKEEEKQKKALTVQAQAVNDAIDSGDIKALFKILPPDKAAIVATGLRAHHPDAMKTYGDKMTLLRDAARGVEALPQGSREKGYLASVQSLVSNGVLTPEEGQQYGAYDPDLNKRLASWGEKPKEGEAGGFTLGKGQVRYGPEGQVIAQGPAEDVKGPTVGTFEDYVVQRFGDRPSPQQITQARKEYSQADNQTSGTGLSPGMESNIVQRLTTQWDKASAPVRELDRQARLMNTGLEAARKGDLAAGSQAVLVTFQKILDPTSVVRESEYARSAAGQSLLSRIQGAAEKLAKGGAGVPVSELEKFKNLADQMVKNAGGDYLKSVRERLGRTADRYQIPRDIVFEDLSFGPNGGGTAAPPTTIDLGMPGVTVRKR